MKNFFAAFTFASAAHIAMDTAHLIIATLHIPHLFYGITIAVLCGLFACNYLLRRLGQ